MGVSRTVWAAVPIVALLFVVCPFGAAAAEDDQLLAAFEAEWAEEPTSFPDPLESWNRGVFVFNRIFDRWTLEPLTRAYAYAVPEPGRLAMRRFFNNLNMPVVFANDFLQGQWQDAGVIVLRFAVNSTAGVGGLFDPAAKWGMEGHDSDFGQTLAVYGMPSGPYLIIPLLGPTTLRDGVGTLVNVMFRPTTYFLAGVDQIYYATIYGGSVGIVIREENAEGLRMLESSSVDYYAAMRSAYYQMRTSEIWRRSVVPTQQASNVAVPG